MEFVGDAAFLIAGACAVAALLGLGGALSDRLDVLTHFTPIYFAGGVLALVLTVVTCVSLALPAALVAIVASSLTMAPELLVALVRRRAGGGETLKLVQFNLWTRNADPAATARWIEDEDADIVVVQEAEGAGALVVAAISRRYPFSVAPSGARDRPTTILSKRRPHASGNIFGGMKQFAGAWATFGDGKDGFTVVAAHCAWPTPAGRQQTQSQRLADFLKGFDRSSLIVAGDFNSTPWSFSLRRQDARFGLARLTRGRFTWPTPRFRRWRLWSPLPFLPLDHVYAGDAWRAASVSLGPPLGSDHLPVVVVLERVG